MMAKAPLVFVALLLLASPRAGWADDLPQMSERSLGSPKAPVTIDEYFSLDCPHCAAFENETLPALKTKYIDTGKARLVLHDFPLSMIAADAAMLTRCADTDRYQTMVATLFRMQNGWVLSTEPASLAALKQQAKFAGMSDGRIDSCLGDQALQNAILQERLDGEKRIAVDVTPTFIFNGDVDDRFDGAAPLDAFVRKIDSLLRK
jgi:protein-disulfide isomerase